MNILCRALARIPKEKLEELFKGYGYKPYFVEGDVPEEVHELLATTLDIIIDEIKQIQNEARANGFTQRPKWPMIIFSTPKGWMGPKEVDGIKRGTWHSHQVPLSQLLENPAPVQLLEQWMKSYKPEELFDESGKLISELAEPSP